MSMCAKQLVFCTYLYCSSHILHPTVLLTDLSWEEGAIFEDAQVVSDGEASQHQTHGQQGGVGVRSHDGLSHHGDVAGGIVTNLLMDHRWEPGVLYGGVKAVIVQDERVGLKYLQQEGGEENRPELRT